MLPCLSDMHDNRWRQDDDRSWLTLNLTLIFIRCTAGDKTWKRKLTVQKQTNGWTPNNVAYHEQLQNSSSLLLLLLLLMMMLLTLHLPGLLTILFKILAIPVGIHFGNAEPVPILWPFCFQH